MTGSSAVRLLGKSGVVCVSLLFALGLSELAVRVFLRERLEPTNHHRLFAEFDPVLGWRKRRNFSAWHVTREYAVREVLNERGLRGELVPYEKPPGELRVLVLGDSFVEGYSVALEDTLCEVLERQLRARRGGPCEVVNAGTGGYGTDQELLFFREEGRRYAPDVTVLAFFYNDVESNVLDAHARYGYIAAKPLFVPEGDGLRLANVPLAQAPRQVGESGPELGPLERTFYLARLLQRWRNVGALRHLGHELGIAGGEARAARRFFAVEELRANGWEMTERLLAELRRETVAAESRLVVFYVPTPALGPEDTELARMLAESCSAAGIARVDPLERFRAEETRLRGESGRGLYHPEDGHWNEAGNALAAQILADFLTSGAPTPQR